MRYRDNHKVIPERQARENNEQRGVDTKCDADKLKEAQGLADLFEGKPEYLQETRITNDKNKPDADQQQHN